MPLPRPLARRPRLWPPTAVPGVPVPSRGTFTYAHCEYMFVFVLFEEENMDDHSDDEAASKLVSTRLPADLHHLVEEAARAELLTNASWIRRAILAAVRESAKGVHRG